MRYAPAYEEQLDPEIIPLCDALNAAGFVTTSSCWGHLYLPPHVWFEHSADERIERMARFALGREQTEISRHYSLFRKEILPRGYLWSLEIRLNYVFANTSAVVARQETVLAIMLVSAAIAEWSTAATDSTSSEEIRWK